MWTNSYEYLEEENKRLQEEVKLLRRIVGLYERIEHVDKSRCQCDIKVGLDN